MRCLLGRAVLLAGIYAFTLQTMLGAAALAASLASPPLAAVCADHPGEPGPASPGGTPECPCGPLCTGSGCGCGGLVAAAGEVLSGPSPSASFGALRDRGRCMPVVRGRQPARGPPLV